MANEEIKNTNQLICEREHAINSIAKSVANMEESLSDILSAESKKIKAVLPTPPYGESSTVSEETDSDYKPKHEPCDDLCCFLAIDKSVKNMVRSITMLEIVLNNKLDLIANCLCPEKTDHVCKKDHKYD